MKPLWGLNLWFLQEVYILSDFSNTSWPNNCKNNDNQQVTRSHARLRLRWLWLHVVYHSAQYRVSLSYLQSKHPQTVVILLRYRHHGDLDALVGHSVLGPVLCTFLQDKTDTRWIFLPIISLYVHLFIHQHHQHHPHLVFLLQVGDHHYDWALLLPHHPPEVAHRVHGRTLGGDVRTLLIAITLHTHTRTYPVLSSHVIFFYWLLRRRWKHEVTWLKIQRLPAPLCL